MLAKRWAGFALALLLLAPAVLAQDAKAKPAGQSEYASLLAQVKNGDLSIDFQRLRLSYMESPERHKAKDTNDQEKAMWQALNGKDYKKAVDNADVVVANEFVNLDAHFVEYRARAELHDDSLSEFHHAVFAGLVKSITDSGDGKTAKTAYVVISTHEEYVVLSIRGLRPGKQSLLHHDGHSYDLLEAKDSKTNETVKVYFNVDIPLNIIWNSKRTK